MEVRNNRKITTKDVATAATVIPVEGDSMHEEELKSDTTHRREELSPLLSSKDEHDLRSRWNDIQTGFVDEPRRAVEEADELVAQIMQRLAQSFSDQKNTLEKQWEHSERVSTEDLRMAFRKYRSFFDRLLSI